MPTNSELGKSVQGISGVHFTESVQLLSARSHVFTNHAYIAQELKNHCCKSVSESGAPWSIHANQKLPISKFIENRQHIMGNKNVLALLAKTL